MDRQGILSNDYFTDAFLGQHQDNIEAADLAHQVDLHGAGIVTGLEVTETDPAPSMSVKVAAGTAYQGYGRRIRIDVAQTVDCSVDRAAAATVPSAGKERYITLVAVFDRQESAPVLDQNTQEYISRESPEHFDLQIVSGDEADPGEAVKYVAAPEEVILADILLDDATTQIDNAMIDTARRSAITNAANQIAEHVAAAAAHSAANISFDPTGTSLPGDPDNVQAAIVAAVKSLPGVIQGLSVSKSDTDTLAISAGACHLRDSGGLDYLVRLAADTTLDVAGLSGGGVGYVYIDSAGALSWSATAPTEDTAKGGWYDAAGDKRFIGSWTYASGAFVDGYRLPDETVRYASDVSLGSSRQWNGFTDEDLSNLVPSIDDAIAFFQISSGTSLKSRKNGTTGAGSTWIYGTGSEAVDDNGVTELDSANQPINDVRIRGYLEPR